MTTEPLTVDTNWYHVDTTDLTADQTEISWDQPAEMCIIRFGIVSGDTPLAGAIISVELDDSDPISGNFLMTREKQVVIANQDGEATVSLPWFVTFNRNRLQRGGIYRVRVSEAGGRCIHERRVLVPSVSSINFEDMADVDPFSELRGPV